MNRKMEEERKARVKARQTEHIPEALKGGYVSLTSQVYRIQSMMPFTFMCRKQSLQILNTVKREYLTHNLF